MWRMKKSPRVPRSPDTSRGSDIGAPTCVTNLNRTHFRQESFP